MLVVDGSAAMDMAARTDKGMALREIMLEGDEAASPTSLRLDLANRFARFMKMKAVSRKVTLECLEAMLTLIDQFVPYEELLPEAFRYIADRDLTVDDALYYALARRLDATLLTSNAELAALCRETDVDCIDASDDEESVSCQAVTGHPVVEPVSTEEEAVDLATTLSMETNGGRRNRIG